MKLYKRIYMATLWRALPSRVAFALYCRGTYVVVPVASLVCRLLRSHRWAACYMPPGASYCQRCQETRR